MKLWERGITMSFIKSIVGWFKRKKDEPKCLSDVISTITPVSTPFGLAAHLDKSFQLSKLDNDIAICRTNILFAKRTKKKSSHLQKQLEGLVARKLELEGK